MSDSLNAGYELDNEESGGEVLEPSGNDTSGITLPNDDPNPEDRQVPDLNEDVTAIASNDAALEDLLYLRADIIAAGGMSQSFAEEALKLAPDFDRGNPIGFYTKQPTATRYKPALEGLGTKIWEAIKNGVKHVLEMIKKFFRWLTGKDKEANPKDVKDQIKEDLKDMDEKQEDLDRLAESAKKIMEEANKGGFKANKPNVEEEIGSFDKMIAAALDEIRDGASVRAFIESRDPMFHDIVNHGAYTKAMEKLIQPMRAAQDMLDQKLVIIHNVFVRDIQSVRASSEMINERDLEKIKDRLEVSFDGKSMLLKDVANSIHMTKQEVMEDAPHKNLSFERVFVMTANAFRSGPLRTLLQSYDGMADTLFDMQRYLKIVEKAVGTPVTDGAQGAPHADTAAALRVVLVSLTADLADLAAIFRQIETYRDVLQHVGSNCVAFAHRMSVVLDRQRKKPEGKDANDPISELKRQAEDVRKSHWRNLKTVLDQNRQ